LDQPTALSTARPFGLKLDGHEIAEQRVKVLVHVDIFQQMADRLIGIPVLVIAQIFGDTTGFGLRPCRRHKL